MPSPSILILTHPTDAHALAAAEALERRGVDYVLWMTPDYPHAAGESVRIAAGEGEDPSALELNVEGLGERAGGEGFTTVWHRRPCFHVDPDALHPADLPVAEKDCGVFREGLFELLAPDAFWINPAWAVRRNNKILQLRAARRAGFVVPETLVSNDPDEIRAFLNRHQGQVIFKPLTASFWKQDETVVAPYTQVVGEELPVPDEMLRATPGIFQALVPKAHELRLTQMGHHALAARVESQSTESGRMDWRRAYGELQLVAEEVAPEVVERCRAVLGELGLVFGCFDLVVTPEGEVVFLEVNQMGQFLFIEEATGQPLLDAFCELLIQGRPDFSFEETRPAIRFSEVLGGIEKRAEQLREAHTPMPSPVQEEREENPVES